MSVFLSIVTRDIHLALRKGSGTANLCFFFLITVSLFPFAVGPKTEILQMIGPGVIWVCALLSSLLSLEHMFEKDYDDGTLEALWLHYSLSEAMIAAKIVAHWCVTGLPLLFFTPLLAMMLALPFDTTLALMGSLLVGTPLLSLIGAIGASLTLGSKRAAGLIPIVILPFMVPGLIFAVASVDIIAGGGDFKAYGSQLMMLVGLLLGFIPLSIFASSAAVKAALEN